MKIQTYLFLILLFGSTSCFSQVDSTKMDWFQDAKLGIFIHWGMYAVDGTSESWAFHNRTVDYPSYFKQKNGFKAENYHPEQWVKLIIESGAKYTVLTTQHHDGLALWNTQQLTPYIDKETWKKAFPNQAYPQGKNALWNSKKPLSTVYQTPAKKDLVQPFVEACRAENLKFGAYYSLLDWSHNSYPGFLKDFSRYELKNDSMKWNDFLRFMHGQISEINTKFKPDLYWFDGDWEHSEAEWKADKIDSIIHTSNSSAILNGRLHSYGDYQTPEQNQPVVRPVKKYWELCLTSNDNWGYRPSDHNYKTTHEVLSIFTECLNMGGNLLLDIAPKADGSIPEEQVKLLQEIGRWTKKHDEAIFGSIAGLPDGHFHGKSTLSKDSTILYLFVDNIIQSDSTGEFIFQVSLKGLKNKIKSTSILGIQNSNLEVKEVGKISWSHVPGTLFISVPSGFLDKEITVIKLELDGKLSLYRGQGGFN